MSSATQLAGAGAEERAARFLASHGLTIVARNFRTRLGEIDLIARDRETLVFVEVRSRASGAYGGAVESITVSKRSRIAAAANAYLALLGSQPPCRFDVMLLEGGAMRWIPSAFDVRD